MSHLEQAQEDISHIWSRFNIRWLLTGLIAGIGAGLVMLAVAALVSSVLSREFIYPAKLIGAALLGGSSLQIGSFAGGFVGIVIHLVLSGFFGLVFAQFVLETSRRRILFLLSILAGLAVWLFWSMMFMPSFNETMLFLLPKTTSLFLHAVFGLSFGLLVIFLRPIVCKE